MLGKFLRGPMKVIVNSDERYPDYIVEPDPGGWEMPDKLYKEYIRALKAYNIVQEQIEVWRDSKVPVCL